MRSKRKSAQTGSDDMTKTYRVKWLTDSAGGELFISAPDAECAALLAAAQVDRRLGVGQAVRIDGVTEWRG